jgi:hypothetical protein
MIQAQSLLHGVRGKFLTAIQSLYNEVKCTVRINNDLTPWFNVEAGVKQSCILSPTLFSVYINDLADRINFLNCGVPFDDFCLSLLLYAKTGLLSKISHAHRVKGFALVHETNMMIFWRFCYHLK